MEGEPTVMETSGPFAALARQKAEAEAAPAAAPAAAAAAAAPEAAATAFDPSKSEWGVAVNNLDWSYPSIDGSPIEGTEPLIKDMDLKLKPGSCCLLLGANGAGKTTLLKILGGKHMVPKGKVLIHGREAFYDVNLTTSGMLSYIGGNWQRDVAFAGYGVTLAGDFAVRMPLIKKRKKKFFLWCALFFGPHTSIKTTKPFSIFLSPRTAPPPPCCLMTPVPSSHTWYHAPYTDRTATYNAHRAKTTLD